MSKAGFVGLRNPHISYCDLVVGIRRVFLRGLKSAFAAGGVCVSGFRLCSPSSYDCPRSCGELSIHAQTIMSFAFQEHTVTRTFPCPNHNFIRVSRAYGDRSVHAPTMIYVL